MTKKQKKILWRILASAGIVMLAVLLPFGKQIRTALFLSAYLIIGYDILKKALHGLKSRQPFDENFLMAIATVGAIALGEFTEGAAVMLFYQVGELFQSYAVGKSRRNIAELMDIRPDYANIMNADGKLIRVSPEEITVGTEIVVQPGEKIPLDGIITEGDAALDMSALTGESLPQDVTVGNTVSGGCVNLNGVLKIQTTKKFEESTVSRILELVENASSKKSRSEKFISKFAKYYTPIVCCSALLLAVVPPLLRIFLLHQPGSFSIWLYRALTFLVISCPCALVISIPLSFFAGIGGAGKAGILIKGANYLETLAQVNQVVLDKTGTLTLGEFRVSGVHHNPEATEKVLEYAALTECYSNHPISKSIKAAYGKAIDTSRVSDVKEISGQGVTALVDEKTVAVGNHKLMDSLSVSWLPCQQPGTVVHVAVDGTYMGHILIRDQMKPQSRDAIADLYRVGIQKTVLLTGDTRTVGEAVTKELGINEVYTELLPEDKVTILEQLMQHKNTKTAFVGDGINDAPVLSRADIGIAMGAIGSDAAIEAADIVLMDDNPAKVTKAIRIARKCMRIVYQNIYISIGIKIACLVLGATGIGNMWTAIFADVGIMVLAILNAMRALTVVDRSDTQRLSF